MSRKLAMMVATAGKLAAAPPVTDWWLSGGIPAANCLGAWRAKGAASLAASYDNLTGDATYDLVTASAPTWDGVNGWKFDGIANYLNTNIVFAGGWSFAFRFTNAAVSVNPIFGGTEGAPANTVCMYANHTGGPRYYDYGNEVNVPGGAINAGTVIIANTKVYLNGVDEGLVLAGTSTNVAAKIFIGVNNIGFYSVVYFQAAAVYDTGLTAPQAAALDTAMAAL